MAAEAKVRLGELEAASKELIRLAVERGEDRSGRAVRLTVEQDCPSRRSRQAGRMNSRLEALDAFSWCWLCVNGRQGAGRQRRRWMWDGKPTSRRQGWQPLVYSTYKMYYVN